MKKYIFLILVGFCASQLQAQEIRDALRYAQDNITGTARFRAMSGAFGALGGDLSAINVNPAGSAIFSNNQVGLSLSNNSISNNSNYFGEKTKQTDNSFDLNQAGGVFVFQNQVFSPSIKQYQYPLEYHYLVWFRYQKPSLLPFQHLLFVLQKLLCQTSFLLGQ